MKNICPFCLRPAELTFEHLWGKWVNNVIPIDRYRMISTDKDGTVHTWRTPNVDAKAKVVCGHCNSAWMSALENRVKSIIGSMASECSASILQSRDVAAIAALTLTKAIVADSMCNPHHPILSSKERQLFAETLEFPVGVQMWLASTSTLRGLFKSDYLKPPINTPGGAFKGQSFTYGIGHFVVQLTVLRYKSKIRRKYANQLSLRQSASWNDFAIPVWPSDGTPISWPARKHLADNLVEVFVQRWNQVSDRRRG